MSRFQDKAGHPRYYALLEKAAEIHAAKNSDYADSQSDPLKNFRECERFGVPAFEGTLVRLTDKFMRICNLHAKAKRGESPAVADEAITDTLLDLANYALIALVLYEEQIYRLPEPVFCTEDGTAYDMRGKLIEDLSTSPTTPRDTASPVNNDSERC